MTIQEIIQSGNAVVIDVRTDLEFNTGHAPGSLNIPLHLLPLQAEKIRSFGKPIILCCASGARSGQAKQFLTAQGIGDCYNAGSWKDVDYLMQVKS